MKKEERSRGHWYFRYLAMGNGGRMVFSAKNLSLNRKGAMNAKGVFGWLVLILEERSESEQTKPPWGCATLGDVGKSVKLFFNILNL